MELHEAVAQELDRQYAPKLANCRWAAHVPLLVAQRNRLENLILTILETVNDDDD